MATNPGDSPIESTKAASLSPRGDDGTAKAEATSEAGLVTATERSTERTEAPAPNQIARFKDHADIEMLRYASRWRAHDDPELAKGLSELADRLEDTIKADPICDCGVGEVFYSHLHVQTCPCAKESDTPPFPSARLRVLLGNWENFAGSEGPLSKGALQCRRDIEELLIASDRLTQYWMRETEKAQAEVSRVREELKEASATIEKLRRFENYVCGVIAMGNQADLTVESLPR